jgi:hypothetical protein
MEKLLKTLNGYSGSKVYLMSNDTKVFIRKINNVDRNYERLTQLKILGYDVPKIYQKTDNVLDMEYIPGLDIKTYLNIHTIDKFLKYVFSLIDSFSSKTIDKDYTEIYYQKLKWLDELNIFPFTKQELINTLPKILPQSAYHGDLTLENIIYSKFDKFYMIDGSTIEYDSWVFDLSKMRQDACSKWFIRNSDDKNLKKYLNIIDQKLVQKYPIINNNSLIILMLLRVFLYTEKNSKDQIFILKEIERLWK